MLSSADYEALARTYGRVGGMDRMATVIKAMRAERGAERVLLLDGGDTLQGSYTALQSKGGDMVRRDAPARRRGNHRPLGVHAGRRSRQRAVRRHRPGRLGRRAVPRRQCARYRFRRPDLRGHAHVREGRRQHRRDRPGVSLHADRQPALDDAELDLRHPRGRRCAGRVARARARTAPRWSCCCRTTASTSTARWRGRVEGIDVILTAHTHDALPAPVQGRPHAADRVGLARQVPVAARPRGARRPHHGFHLHADPDPGRCDRARSRHGAADRRDPRAARGDAGDRAGAQRERCCSGAARSAARSTT